MGDQHHDAWAQYKCPGGWNTCRWQEKECESSALGAIQIKENDG